MIRKMSKRGIVKNNIKEGHSDMDYGRVKQVYGLTPSEFRLYKTAKNNLDTEKGYEAYYALMTAIKNRNGDDTVLYDLAASFAWDDKLAKAGDRYGYPYEDINDITIKESYSDIWSENVWDACDIALAYLGADGLCEELAKAMGTDELADNLKYIFRVNEIPFMDDKEFEKDFDESIVKESHDKKWLNVEVTEDEYRKLKKFLVDHNIKHEASGAYNMIHVEVYVDEYERQKVNDFLDTLDEGCRSCKKKPIKKRTSRKEAFAYGDKYEVVLKGTYGTTGYPFSEIIHVTARNEEEAAESAIKKFLANNPGIDISDIEHYDVISDEDEFAEIDLYDEGCHSGKKKSVRKGTKRK